MTQWLYPTSMDLLNCPLNEPSSLWHCLNRLTQLQCQVHWGCITCSEFSVKLIYLGLGLVCVDRALGVLMTRLTAVEAMILLAKYIMNIASCRDTIIRKRMRGFMVIGYRMRKLDPACWLQRCGGENLVRAGNSVRGKSNIEDHGVISEIGHGNAKIIDKAKEWVKPVRSCQRGNCSMCVTLVGSGRIWLGWMIWYKKATSSRKSLGFSWEQCRPL